MRKFPKTITKWILLGTVFVLVVQFFIEDLSPWQLCLKAVPTPDTNFRQLNVNTINRPILQRFLNASGDPAEKHDPLDHGQISQRDRLQVSKTLLEAAGADMVKRRGQVQKACHMMGPIKSNKSGPHTFPRALVSVQKAVVYCPVEKTASTFFRRYLYQLDHTDPMRSPFEVPIKMIYACPELFTSLRQHARTLAMKAQRKAARLAKRRKRPPKSNITISRDETVDHFLDTSTKFIFVRDPYWRLYSAYVDKLLAPNPLYWDLWGRTAVKRRKKSPSQLSLECGHDVTFEEFLSFVLKLNVSHDEADPHLRPVYHMCSPCTLNYAVIGLMETFHRDVVYLSSLLNVSESQIEFHKMAADSARDAIQDSVTDAFTDWSARISKCLTKENAVRRIWMKMQIRGFISQRLNIPFNNGSLSIDNIDASDLIDLLTNAWKLSKDQTELRLQKKQAFTRMYKTVKKNVLRKIAKMFQPDFRAFGFSMRPKVIFDRSSGESFNYSQFFDM